MSEIRRNSDAGKGKPRFEFTREPKDAVSENELIDAFDAIDEDEKLLEDLEKEEIGELSEEELAEFGRTQDPEKEEHFGDPTRRK